MPLTLFCHFYTLVNFLLLDHQLWEESKKLGRRSSVAGKEQGHDFSRAFNFVVHAINLFRGRPELELSGLFPECSTTDGVK